MGKSRFSEKLLQSKISKGFLHPSPSNQAAPFWFKPLEKRNVNMKRSYSFLGESDVSRGVSFFQL